MPVIRIIFRILVLWWSISQAVARFLWLRWRTKGEVTAQQRAEWLHSCCRNGLPYVGIHFTVQGTPPTSGLVVSNHLSYVDILIFSAITPCVFVAKREIAGWPIFGWMSHMAGTIFIDRARRTEAHAVQNEMQKRLAEGVTVVLFPEGTSSDGSTLLPFRSALFHAAVASEAGISAARISYQVSDGKPETDACFWGEMKMTPHVLKLLSKKRVTGHVQFGERMHQFTDRKEAARIMYAKVVALGGRSPAETLA